MRNEEASEELYFIIYYFLNLKLKAYFYTILGV